MKTFHWAITWANKDRSGGWGRSDGGPYRTEEARNGAMMRAKAQIQAQGKVVTTSRYRTGEAANGARCIEDVRGEEVGK